MILSIWVKTLIVINVLDLVKQKRFYPYKYMREFEKFKEELPSTETFYSSLTDIKVGGKNYEHAVKVLNAFEMKAKIITICI